uniref:Uncharacterized protein n=1 Tax=Anguilla anguilla TaxID=7936 RepID=A0A0E9PED9_ANGAN
MHGTAFPGHVVERRLSNPALVFFFSQVINTTITAADWPDCLHT